MADSTPRLDLPYPELGDPSDVPSDFEALAARVEALTNWIRESDLQSDAVTTAKIDDGAVTEPKIDANLALKLLPVGAITAYAGNTAPSGWVKCEGQAITGAFATLRAFLIAQGNPYGVSGTDPLAPNLKGRIVVGTGTGSGDGAAGTGAIPATNPLTARNLAAFTGKQTHTLLSAESAFPMHDHGGNTNNNASIDHGHGFHGYHIPAAAGVWAYFLAPVDSNFPMYPATHDSNAGTSLTTTSGSGSLLHTHPIPGQTKAQADNGHNNVQPMLALSYIIKA